MTRQESGFQHEPIYAFLAFKYESRRKRLLRNSHSTVPVYADECELLVFGAFSTVSQRIEAVFRYAEGLSHRGGETAPLFYVTGIPES